MRAIARGPGDSPRGGGAAGEGERECTFVVASIVKIWMNIIAPNEGDLSEWWRKCGRKIGIEMFVLVLRIPPRHM